MNYDDLTTEFIRNMQLIRKATHKGRIPDSIQGETFVLIFIKERHGKIIPSDISDAIGVSSARVATALNSLENKGLITRRIDSDDRRKIIVELTPEGMKLAEERKKAHTERIGAMLALLGEEDSAELVRIVGRLSDIISKDSTLCDR
ncbi:transcriptional regulator SlyA [Candidatus Methanoplasma termitum]|uniref:SlyA protein n=1 Tax=Candidatus Methanoplasma termitum TaxID=1577791 RepID=A0A0A7LIG9_9ARCH|nr:MarR family transcriptional regulator [Candidatus Methanoplasma termitum]AIZ57306.1 transcriptional regulator SlyA [Candidatus Methanoplasma termitum]MCL2334319.1 winged helix DNA-binding protein [Candidatus Methanoplasma sp.]